MHTAANNNLVLTGCSSLAMSADLPTSIVQAEFYQQLGQELIKGVYTWQAHDRLGKRLIALAHHSYTFRRMDAVEQVSQILMNLRPPNQYRSIGCFYQALSLKRQGQFAEARTLLERVADKVPPWYRGRIILSLAGLAFDSGDSHSALLLYVEANRAAALSKEGDVFTLAEAQRQIARLPY